MSKRWWMVGLLLVAVGTADAATRAARFSVSYPETTHAGALDGRVVLIVAKRPSPEPRFQVSWRTSTAQIFGVDVEGFKPGQSVTIDATAPGHPLRSMAELPDGTYHVQAVLNVYETFERADGHTVKLPADNGEGQHWDRSPGNLYSVPQEVAVDAKAKIEVTLTEVVPPIEPPEDTPYVRRFRMQSELLTAFWGRPVFISAIVLVPPGFDDNPDGRYPVFYQQGHFPSRMRFWSETPPGPDVEGRARRFADARYAFYQDWDAGRMPKMLVVLTQHATPYYDDSYGVDSANTGPYGRALIEEFYPALEEQFHAIGESWARVLAGGSTGGWISLAQQIFYPDFFGGAWGWCPDPVDFHAFQSLDVYDEDDHAFYVKGPFKRVAKGVGRGRDGQNFATVEDFTRQEYVLGNHGRSGGQLDAFHATFGPVGDAGYPARLWDPLTGDVDPAIAAYWREHFDLTARLARDWETLGPKLIGKLHLTMGTKDTFFLETAAYRMERFLEDTQKPGKGPYYAGSFDFGDNEPHCYTGTPDGQETYRYYLPVFAEHMRSMAPEGADVESWR